MAKVWGQRPAGHLRRLGSFYAYFDSAGLPFLTPLFHEVREVSGRAVTMERPLPGVPLDDKRFPGPGASPGALSCVVSGLEALTDVHDAPRLRGLAATEDTMIALAHGDLIPGNILVDDGLRPLAVLDFGFLSTSADPAFDAAVTASVYDMYSPAARETERRLDEALISQFGYDLGRLALYRAAYAVITSTAYDPVRPGRTLPVVR